MTETTQPRRQDGDSLPGFFLALATYVFWGFLPFYMKALAHIAPAEVVAHRILWSVPVAGAVLVATGRTADLARALRTPKMLGMGALTAAIVSLNWGIYVWAIGSGHALDAALGYYINPLFSIFLGRVLLHERLLPAQWLAIGLACVAVAILTWEVGRVPVVALSLPLTWGIYAFFKRSLPIGPNQGFMLEILMLAPFALGYMIRQALIGQSHFLQGVPFDTAMLLGCGAVTAVPLILYANAAKRLTLSTIAIMQYIAPTMIFLIAVFIFGEPFGRAQAIAFPLIWAALVLYTFAMIRQAKRANRASSP